MQNQNSEMQVELESLHELRRMLKSYRDKSTLDVVEKRIKHVERLLQAKENKILEVDAPWKTTN